MTQGVASEWALVGDIGGTNARFALVRPGTTALEQVKVLPCLAYPNLDGAVQDYLKQVGVSGVNQSCLAFACPVQDAHIKLTNAHWAFEKRVMQNQLGMDVFKVVNDFTAMALGVLHVAEDQRFQVGGESTRKGAPVLVIGPGTGLGVSGLIPTAQGWLPLATEGGHVDLVASDDLELAVLSNLRSRFGRVSAERALCGEGLENIYRAIQVEQGLPVNPLRAPEITAAALSQSDPIALATLDLFCALLGRVAGNAALTLGALGGVYVCGGIIPRISEFFQHSRFRACFEDKGRMGAYLKPVPVWVVTDNYTGLRGAAAALDNPVVQ